METLSRMIGGSVDYNAPTESELHAEACYATLLVFRANMMMIEEESIMSLVRAALKMRTCHQTYKWV